MNRIKTILIDDEPRGLSSLKKLLQINCPEVNVVATCDSADSAIEKINELNPQLIFLDIAMPGKSGFDLLKFLQQINFEIIFVTAHNNYMNQAFHFSAVDYLLKPVDDELLIEAVERAGKRIEEKNGGRHVEAFLHNMQQKNSSQKMKICIPSLKGFQFIDLQDIIYCEASSNYTNFHFTNRPTIITAKSIHDYDELLEDSNFMRIHKTYLVNLEHVTEYIKGEGGSVILSNGKELDVSRRKKEALIIRLKTYYKF
ncbi:MAG: LytTR family DNA-binding domain-containing protein [Ferruginibacter sp.]